MSFTERDKAKAFAIVHVFETGKALGDYGVVAVLPDGAGFSVGINQFTHGSGSLAAVLDRYARLGGAMPDKIVEAMPDFRAKRNIAGRSSDRALKAAIKSLAPNLKWQKAQREIAFENYLGPAIKACEGSGFKCALSLAVVYQSHNQGGYSIIRDRVSADPENEKAWIAEYCADRKHWLATHKKKILRNTVTAPNFFLGQIAHGNWNLELPLNVNGVKITEQLLFPVSAADTETPATQSPLEAEPVESPNPPADQPPNESGTIETTKIDGKPVLEKTTETPGTVTIETQPEYKGVGLIATLKKDFYAVGGGNLSFQSLQAYAEQASGWPPWVISLITKLATIAAILGVAWLLFRFAHYVVWKIGGFWREHTQANINADPNKKDVEFKAV